jgi:hypothetical protein
LVEPQGYADKRRFSHRSHSKPEESDRELTRA